MTKVRPLMFFAASVQSQTASPEACSDVATAWRGGDLVVVAPEDGPAAADVGTADEAEQGLAHRPGRRHGERIGRERLVQPGGAQRLRVAKRHVVDQEVEGQVAHHGSAIGHHQASRVGDRPDHVRVEVPAVELHLHRGRVPASPTSSIRS